MGKKKINKGEESTSVNRKARLVRHLRIFKEGQNDNKKVIEKISNKKSYGYSFVLFSVLIVLPLYPNLSSSVYGNSKTDFYRGYIDEESILGSYVGSDEEEDLNSSSPLIDTNDSYLSVNTLLNDSRDLSGTNEIISYEVKPNDSFYSIAYKFKVSVNSIYWANDFSKNQVLRPGDKIKVPPVSGIIHSVKSGDTISGIAKKYDIPESKILEQNGISKKDSLIAGGVIVVPGAVKIVAAPVIKASPTKFTATNSKTTNTPSYSFSQYANSQYVNAGGSYKLVWRAPFSGVKGNCTWYVASYKNVDWRGNANQWLKNARAKGHATGSSPSVGAIVSFNGRGYNPRYGHVGIVMDVKSDHIIVSDMNYRRLGEVTYRKVPINDRAITGYIYVD